MQSREAGAHALDSTDDSGDAHPTQTHIQDAKVRAILSQRDAREGKQPEGAVAGLPPNVEVVSKDLGSVSSADCSGAQVRVEGQ